MRKLKVIVKGFKRIEADRVLIWLSIGEAAQK